MSAKEELIAAALAECDLMTGMFGYEPASLRDLREAAARAMVQPAPDMAEVERRLETYEEACRSGQWEPERTALLDYARGVLAERDALIADNERLMQIVSQEVSAALQPATGADLAVYQAIADNYFKDTQPVGEAAASVFRMSCPEAQAVLSDPYGLRPLMDYEDQRYSQAESMCGAEEIGQWPTARWTELREKGRQIMSEDLEIWDSDIKAAFGFDKTPQPVGEFCTDYHCPGDCGLNGHGYQHAPQPVSAAEVPMPERTGHFRNGKPRNEVCYCGKQMRDGQTCQMCGYTLHPQFMEVPMPEPYCHLTTGSVEWMRSSPETRTVSATASGQPKENTRPVFVGEQLRTYGEQCRAAGYADFQERVRPWMLACFGVVIANDRMERNHRFLEEALELVQACGCTQSEAHQLVDYVFSRPVGEKRQEVGGVMVTLAALCLAQNLDMHADGETELARIWTNVEQIRAKQAAKPRHSPQPVSAAEVPMPERTGHFRNGKPRNEVCYCGKQMRDGQTCQTGGYTLHPQFMEVPMPDVAGELFDGKRVCDEADVRTYGDAREAAGYARGLAAVGWRDVADEPPKEAQEVLFVRGGKTIHGAWIGGIFWHNNQKMAAAKWMPLPAPQTEAALRGEVKP